MTAVWARRVADAGPERMCTFTRIGETRDDIRVGLQHIVRRFRKAGFDFEYWGVVELHKSLKPHMHLLQKGSYIHKTDFNAAVWAEGWGRCNIKRVTAGFSAAYYCGKHLCHSHHRRWEGRLVRYSKHFFDGAPAAAAAECDREDTQWHCVFGRCPDVAQVLRKKGVRVLEAEMPPDWLVNEPKVRGEVMPTRNRSGAMGYRLLGSLELYDLLHEWKGDK